MRRVIFCFRFVRLTKFKHPMPYNLHQDLERHWEAALRKVTCAYPSRRANQWQCRYDSLAAFLQSVEPNRKQWAKLVSGLPEFAGEMQADTKKITASRQLITLHLSPTLQAHALFQTPANEDHVGFPLVVCLHGIGGAPEMILGDDETAPPSYHAYGRKLTEHGYAVLAPYLINNFAARGRLHRIALLLGTTIWGLESQLLRRLLDFAVAELPIDARRIAMWGLSMGGAYTMHTLPIEPRLAAGIVSAWFNHRVRKMIVEDPHYTCFLPTAEEHAFLPGLLTHFSDRDLLALICPRPLLIQTGETDSVSWPPLVKEEFDAGCIPYDRLHLSERLQWNLHGGGHEIEFDSGLDFLNKWL